MPAWLGLKQTSSSDIPTPGTGVANIFLDPTLGPAYKTPAGLILPFTGPMGPMGPPGATGGPGPEGTMGSPGTPGSPGPAGSAGPSGSQGGMGPPGSNGVDGLMGVMGPQGLQGSPGPTGAVGPSGTNGSMGPPGLTGLQGEMGFMGVPGPPGASVAGTATAGPETCCGRLTLETGVAISTTDQTAKTDVFWTPFRGNRISLYNGSAWETLSFTQITLALGTLTSGKNYDVFAFISAGAVALELSAAWTDDVTRADALTLQDGVLVKSGAVTRRYLGTFRTTSTTTTEDSGGGVTTVVGAKRFLWNYYNRVRRPMKVHDTTASYTYGTDTWRQARANAGNQVEYVCGANEDIVHMFLTRGYAGVSNTTRTARVSIGLDSTTVPSLFIGDAFNGAGSGQNKVITAPYNEMAGVGYHFLASLEKGAAAGTSTFYDAINGAQAGMSGFILG